MILQKLNEIGVDGNSLLERLIGNKDLIDILFQKFINDQNFNNLTQAIKKKDVKEIYNASHNLKGLCSNLSITKLSFLFSKQVDFIKNDHINEAIEMMPSICDEYYLTINNLKNYLNEK